MTYAGVLLLFAACRTARPPNAQPLVPLSANSPADAAKQLAARRAAFAGERSLVRLRLGTMSTRGQLQVDATGRMLLTLYSPIGTTLARLYADGDDVIVLNDFQSTVWRGKASDLSGTLGIFGTTPSSLALLLIGLPPAGLESITYSSAGMETVHLGDVTIAYNPPSYPPTRVSIDRGTRHLEIEHLESYADNEPVKAPDIPREYRCCFLPEL